MFRKVLPLQPFFGDVGGFDGESQSQAGEELSPALVANYIYDLAKEYNQFYQDVPVLREEDQEVIAFRLQLSSVAGEVIRKGMGLLGINVPARM